MSAVFTRDISEAADVIKRGGVIICPTEGVYGISCSLFDEDAVRRVICIKERDESKGLIVADCSLDTLKHRVLDQRLLTEHAVSLMKRYWPGPHTFIVPCRKDFFSEAKRADNSLAVRITAFETFASLCRLCSAPLISTSANISGKSAVSALDSLDNEIVKRVDLVLCLPCQGQSSPSSIYDTRTAVTLRYGPNWNES